MSTEAVRVRNAIITKAGHTAASFIKPARTKVPAKRVAFKIDNIKVNERHPVIQEVRRREEAAAQQEEATWQGLEELLGMNRKDIIRIMYSAPGKQEA